MPIYEDGHARNVERMETLISFLTSYGAAYAPSNTAITIANLGASRFAAAGAIDDVTNSLAQQKVFVNTRENLFEPLPQLSTRITNMFVASGADDNAIEDLRALNRKIQGKRTSPLPVDDPNTPEDESLDTVSSSQRSYTQLVEHLEAMIELLNSDGNYAPSETELQTSSLVTLVNDMKVANTAVMNANTTLSTMRIARNDLMYAENTGLVDLALTAKAYVKAVFGADSPQYAQISGLKFTRPRDN